MKDNFKDDAGLDKIKIQEEDDKYFYCDSMVLEKNLLYQVKESKNGMCRCYGYDMNLIELQMMKYRLSQLEKNQSQEAEMNLLRKIIADIRGNYEFILSGE